MTQGGMREYLYAFRNRYILADLKEKCRILDGAVRVTGLHRKALIRALRSQPRLETRALQSGGRRCPEDLVGSQRPGMWQAVCNPSSQS